MPAARTHDEKRHFEELGIAKTVMPGAEAQGALEDSDLSQPSEEPTVATLKAQLEIERLRASKLELQVKERDVEAENEKLKALLRAQSADKLQPGGPKTHRVRAYADDEDSSPTLDDIDKYIKEEAKKTAQSQWASRQQAVQRNQKTNKLLMNLAKGAQTQGKQQVVENKRNERKLELEDKRNEYETKKLDDKISDLDATNPREAEIDKLSEETEYLQALADRNEQAGDMSAELHGMQATPADLLERDGFLTIESGIGADSGVGPMVTPEKLESMQPYPGVDYLGAGYDIFHGNPSGDELNLIDPGFRQPIRAVTYEGVSLTRDNTYLTPDGSYSIPKRSCYRVTQLSDMSSESAFQHSMSRDINFGGGASGGKFGYSFGLAFDVSLGKRSAEADAMARSESRFEAKSYCSKYEVGWLHGVTQPEDLTPQFRRDAWHALFFYRLLKVTNSGSKVNFQLRDVVASLFKQLFSVYGTHVVDVVTLGGKVVYTKFISSESMDQLRDHGYDTSVEASVEFGTPVVKGNVYGGYKESGTAREEFKKTFRNSRERLVVMGGTPSHENAASTDTGFADWAAGVDHNPMPIKYTLSPLSVLAQAVAEAVAPPPFPPPPPKPPPPPYAPAVEMLPIVAPSKRSATLAHKAVSSLDSKKASSLPLNANMDVGDIIALLNPPPPPKAPKSAAEFGFKENCHRGVAVGGSKATVGAVDVDPKNIYPALRDCWEAVWHSFPSPFDPDLVADGFALGVGCEPDCEKQKLAYGRNAPPLNVGECYALFSPEGYEAKEVQDSDWVYCEAPRTTGLGGLTANFEIEPPPPPPNPPPPPPPSPPPPPISSDGQMWIDAYTEYLPQFVTASTQEPFFYAAANILELPGGFCQDTNGNDDRKDSSGTISWENDNNNPLIAHHSTCGGADARSSAPCRGSVTGSVNEQRQKCYRKCFPKQTVTLPDRPNVTDATGPQTCSACMDYNGAWCHHEAKCMEKMPGQNLPECSGGTGGGAYLLGGGDNDESSSMGACAHLDTNMDDDLAGCMKHTSCHTCTGSLTANRRCAWCETLGCFPIRVALEERAPTCDKECDIPTDKFPVFGKTPHLFAETIWPMCQKNSWKFPAGTKDYALWLDHDYDGTSFGGWAKKDVQEIKQQAARIQKRGYAYVPNKVSAASAASDLRELPGALGQGEDLYDAEIDRHTAGVLTSCQDVERHGYCIHRLAQQHCPRTCANQTHEVSGMHTVAASKGGNDKKKDKDGYKTVEQIEKQEFWRDYLSLLQSHKILHNVESHQLSCDRVAPPPKQDKLQYGLQWIKVPSKPESPAAEVETKVVKEGSSERYPNPLPESLKTKDTFTREQWEQQCKDGKGFSVSCTKVLPLVQRYNYVRVDMPGVGTVYFQPTSVGLAWERSVSRPTCEDELILPKLREELEDKLTTVLDAAKDKNADQRVTIDQRFQGNKFGKETLTQKNFIEVRVARAQAPQEEDDGDFTEPRYCYLSSGLDWDCSRNRPTCDEELLGGQGASAKRKQFAATKRHEYTTTQLDSILGNSDKSQVPAGLTETSFIDIRPGECSSCHDHRYYVPLTVRAPSPLEVPGFLLRPHHSDTASGECTCLSACASVGYNGDATNERSFDYQQQLILNCNRQTGGVPEICTANSQTWPPALRTEIGVSTFMESLTESYRVLRGMDPPSTFEMSARSFDELEHAQMACLDSWPLSTFDCDPGTFVAIGKPDMCMKCPAGKYRQAGEPTCSDCTPGKYSHEGATSCSQCALGEFNPSYGAAKCSECEDGTSSNAQFTMCLDCDAGKYAVGGTCIKCPRGSYQPASKQAECQLCGSGKFGKTGEGHIREMDACQDCAEGTSNSQPGLNHECPVCPLGYHAAAASTECTECDAGTRGTTPPSATCPACSPGTFSGEPAATSCTQCEPGKYSDSEASESCTPCPEFTWSGYGAKSCYGPPPSPPPPTPPPPSPPLPPSLPAPSPPPPDRCCWSRQLQSCWVDSDCDAGGEGCINSGDMTSQYGRVTCSTCESRGMVYSPTQYACVAPETVIAGPASTPTKGQVRRENGVPLTSGEKFSPEMYITGASGHPDGWYPICGHHFWSNGNAANLACKNLYQSSGCTGGAIQYENRYVPYSKDAVQVGECTSSDTDITRCTGGNNGLSVGGWLCTHSDQMRTVIKCNAGCTTPMIAPFTQPGAVRAEGGKAIIPGEAFTPEIYVTGDSSHPAGWYPICGHFFWDRDAGAQVACQHLAGQIGTCDSSSATTSSLKRTIALSKDAFRVGACRSADADLLSCTGYLSSNTRTFDSTCTRSTSNTVRVQITCPAECIPPGQRRSFQKVGDNFCLTATDEDPHGIPFTGASTRAECEQACLASSSCSAFEWYQNVNKLTSCADGDGAEYLGSIATTASGRTCQAWASDSPHIVQRPFNTQSSNFCRNPNGESRPWCYTTDPELRWELCSIPTCKAYHSAQCFLMPLSPPSVKASGGARYRDAECWVKRTASAVEALTLPAPAPTRSELAVSAPTAFDMQTPSESFVARAEASAAETASELMSSDSVVALAASTSLASRTPPSPPRCVGIVRHVNGKFTLVQATADETSSATSGRFEHAPLKSSWLLVQPGKCTSDTSVCEAGHFVDEGAAPYIRLEKADSSVLDVTSAGAVRWKLDPETRRAAISLVDVPPVGSVRSIGGGRVLSGTPFTPEVWWESSDEDKSDPAGWYPLCGAGFWVNDDGASIACKNLLGGTGCTSGHRAITQGKYSKDAVYVGTCTGTDADLSKCTGGSNYFSKRPSSEGSQCGKGNPVSIKLTCNAGCETAGDPPVWSTAFSTHTVPYRVTFKMVCPKGTDYIAAGLKADASRTSDDPDALDYSFRCRRNLKRNQLRLEVYEKMNREDAKPVKITLPSYDGAKAHDEKSVLEIKIVGSAKLDACEEGEVVSDGVCVPAPARYGKKTNAGHPSVFRKVQFLVDGKVVHTSSSSLHGDVHFAATLPDDLSASIIEMTNDAPANQTATDRVHSAGCRSSFGCTDACCRKCPAGTYSTKPQANFCTPCPNSQVSFAGAAGCMSHCPTGYARDETNKNTCTKCPEGQTSTSGGPCECPAGSEAHEVQKGVCERCEEGKTSVQGGRCLTSEERQKLEQQSKPAEQSDEKKPAEQSDEKKPAEQSDQKKPAEQSDEQQAEKPDSDKSSGSLDCPGVSSAAGKSAVANCDASKGDEEICTKSVVVKKDKTSGKVLGVKMCEWQAPGCKVAKSKWQSC